MAVESTLYNLKNSVPLAKLPSLSCCLLSAWSAKRKARYGQTVIPWRVRDGWVFTLYFVPKTRFEYQIRNAANTIDIPVPNHIDEFTLSSPIRGTS